LDQGVTSSSLRICIADGMPALVRLKDRKKVENGALDHARDLRWRRLLA
jgi:hypothetical protein